MHTQIDTYTYIGLPVWSNWLRPKSETKRLNNINAWIISILRQKPARRDESTGRSWWGKERPPSSRRGDGGRAESVVVRSASCESLSSTELNIRTATRDAAGFALNHKRSAGMISAQKGKRLMEKRWVRLYDLWEDSSKGAIPCSMSERIFIQTKQSQRCEEIAKRKENSTLPDCI